jgi:hypothetical protein
MRKLFISAAFLALSLFMVFFAEASLPENGSTCLPNAYGCDTTDHYQSTTDQTDPGCDELPNANCGNGTNVGCSYCVGTTDKQNNICVQYYSGPGCLIDDNSLDCGTMFTSVCQSGAIYIPPFSTCHCNSMLAVNTGNPCSFPTCTGDR